MNAKDHVALSQTLAKERVALVEEATLKGEEAV